MKLLLLGGTRFLGRHITAAALARDHSVTLFHRGRHEADDLGHIERIHGDRHTDLDRLRDRRWDAVIDTSGHLPRAVTSAAEVLASSVEQYVFISSQNVYSSVSVPGVDETAPVATLTAEQLSEANAIDTAGEPAYGKMYGPLKALCEEAAEQVMPGRVLIVRPGLIVGPHDYSDRFTYWVVRVARGGEVLAPASPGRWIQLIDVRDLSEWVVDMVERQQTGVYNTSGRPNTFTMENLLEECKSVSGSDATFTWVNEEFLLQAGVAPWSELPLWLPETAAPHLRGFMFVNSDKAVASGLAYRPLRETIKDTLDWFQTSCSIRPLEAGIDRDKEKLLLSRWHETS